MCDGYSFSPQVLPGNSSVSCRSLPNHLSAPPGHHSPHLGPDEATLSFSQYPEANFLDSFHFFFLCNVAQFKIKEIKDDLGCTFELFNRKLFSI